MKTVFIINAAGQIEQVNYSKLIWQFADETTTPHGVGYRLHIRQESWFKVGNEFYKQQASAEDSANDIERETGQRPLIEEVTLFGGWTWGHLGNFPKRITVFDTQEEADKWLFERAEFDFQSDCNTPMIFDSRAEAEQWIVENNSDE